MPIKPENMAAYPGGSIKSPQWQAIRSYIRARAGDRCEECGVRHLTYGYRDVGGIFYDFGLDKGLAGSLYLDAVYLTTKEEVGNLFRIVCTVAHMDQQLVDHSAANLRFLCQRDHNRLDAKSRAINAARTRKINTHGPDLVEWIEGHV